MGATLTINETSTQMIRLVGDKLVQEESQRNLYTVPPKGEYTFQITGYALPFDIPKAEEYGGGTQTMTRLECTITEGNGAGKMFTLMLGFSLGMKSNLGRLLRGFEVDLTPVEGKWDLDRAIGYTGKAFIVPSDTLDDFGKPKYAKLALDAGVEAISAPETPYSIEVQETAPAAPASNGTPKATDDGWE